MTSKRRLQPEEPDEFSEPLGKPFTMDDPLWALVGMFDDPDGGWVSGDIHRAVAEAIYAKFHRDDDSNP